MDLKDEIKDGNAHAEVRSGEPAFPVPEGVGNMEFWRHGLTVREYMALIIYSKNMNYTTPHEAARKADTLLFALQTVK